MADFDPARDADDLDSSEVEVSAASRIGAVLNLMGAMASLALIAGVAIWGYKLVMRDVSGVPVVRAVDGPMRLAPEDPGGRPADHQGLAVNAVAARGGAEAPADRLVLAPRPVDLLAEDKPMPVIAARAAEAAAPVHDIDSDAEDTTVDADASNAEDRDQAVTMQAVVNRLIADVLPDEDPDSGPKIVRATVRAPALPTDQTAGETTAVQPETEPPETAEDDAVSVMPTVLGGPGLKRSPRPQPRPAQLMKASLEAPQASAAPRDINPETIPAGAKLAQLGAFESREVAEQEWRRLDARFADYLAGKDRVIQKTTSGGRTFFRLRAMGFDDLSDARRFCSALVAEKADCIPVVVR